jgi:parallel beta-helix repeat protein
MSWVLRGAKVTNSNYCSLLNLRIHYVADYGIWFSGQSNYNRVMNNSICHVGSWYWKNGDGIFLDGGHHNLIDGNDISDIGHNPIATRGDHTDTYNNIIQNNIVHDSARSGLNANFNTHHEVWKNNLSYRNIVGIQNDSNNNIIRNNVFFQNGAGIALYSTDNRLVQGNKVFGNTLFNNNTNPDKDYAHEILIAEYMRGGGCNRNDFKNNIIYGTLKSYLVWFDGKLLKGNNFSHNNFYAEKPVGIRVTPLGVKSISWWQEMYALNFLGNIISDPLFVNSEETNFSLNATSSCIDAGAFLTKVVGSGRGNTIKVVDAGYFFDGFGITDGDLIQIEGSVEKLRILKIDYEKQTIEIERDISWKDADGVSLPYSGSAPDIGAFEYEQIIPPQSIKLQCVGSSAGVRPASDPMSQTR